MRKTAILLALACAFARADYGPGTTDSDLLRSGTPVVTNAWLAVSNDTAGLVRSMAGDKITDGTNMIDAARNVYLVRDNCWIRRDGLVLVPDAEIANTWVSITNTIYGEVSLYNSGSMWQEFETAIPTFLFRDGATLTNDDGVVVYRAGEYNSVVGRLALTNDIPAAPDFTTSNTQLVQTIRSTAPAPGNYLTVSNAAMNARSMSDLGVRGAPHGEGSWFVVDGYVLAKSPFGTFWSVENLYQVVAVASEYQLNKWAGGGWTGIGTFALNESFSSVLDGHTIIGYTNMLAQVSQIPAVPHGVVVTNAQGVVEANLGIYGSLAQGTNVTASGAFSHAEGDRSLASGKAAHAEGVMTRALGEASHASGVNVYATQRATFGAGVSVNGTNSASFIWSGQETSPWYGTHGKGSFNVDPIGGIAGMWVGNDALLSILYASLMSDEPHTATIEFDEVSGTSVTTNLPPLREAVVGTIREHSLGGIWDSRLGVWWRPVMENGALRYVAATNVNLSAEGNQ